MEDQYILCDASSLISLTDADLDSLIPYLKKHFHVQFLIPPSVEEEMVTRPIKKNLREYLYSALKIKKSIRDMELTKVSHDVTSETQKLLNAANSTFFAKGRPLRLVHYGEAEIIATAKKLGTPSLLIDERTTRLFIESPLTLKTHLEQEFNVNIMVQKSNLDFVSSFVDQMKVIRSSELIILGYENHFFDSYEDMKRDVLTAALYKIKYSGCSIGFDEIDSFTRKVK